jgi:tetratricopeptide (TPR) repeat protein
MPDALRAALKAALDAFLQTRDLEEGRELPAEAPGLEERRVQLNTAYWKAVRELVSQAVIDDALTLGDEQRALLDYGLFSAHALEAAARRLCGGEQVDGVLLFHESLQGVLDDVRRRDAIAELSRDLASLSRDIELWPETHLAHTRYRDARVHELLGDSPRGAHVLRLLAEMDEKLENYIRLQARGREGALSKEERRAWSTLRHYVESRREQVAAALLPPASDFNPDRGALASSVHATMEAVEASAGHLLELHAKRRAIEQQILEQQTAARRVTPAEIRKALLRELDSVAGLLRLAARYAHVSECAVPVEDGVEFIDAGRAADAMAHILQFDPRLIDNPLAARFGPPELLLAPGIGDGVFDGGRNRWVVPQRCAGGAIVSLAHAAVMYRLEVDAAELNKALLASYRESVPANRGIRANLKLRNGLIRDYIAWMSREALGEEVLPRETREWFERHIGPNKEHPWVPPEYRGRNEQQLARLRRELEAESMSAEREYRMGVLEWLLAPRDPDAILERALPRLQHAARLEPAHRGALWSCAALHMQLGQFQQAIDAFQRFTDVAPRSWWTRKAIELCAQCR